MKKKVIWHLPYAMIGGVETLYATILKHINRTDIQHFVTCHDAILPWCKEKFKKNAIILPFNDAKGLAETLDSVKPDIIMGTHGRTLYDAISMTEGYDVIEVVHGSHIWSEHNCRMPKDWTKHVVCVSKSAKETYLRGSANSAASNVPCSIIINGIDTDVFHPTRGLQKKPRVVGYMGRFLESDKHIKSLIKAFKSLGDHSARLHLIGGSPTEIVHIKHFVRSLKMESRVKLFPHCMDPEKYFKNIDVFTVRSEAEGYCNAVAEALASGVPTVCYSFGGILDHVPRGTIAVGKNQQEYASQLKEVFRNYSLRERMRNQGLNFIQKEGNAKIMAKRYEEIIHNYEKEVVEPKRRTIEVDAPLKESINPTEFEFAPQIQGRIASELDSVVGVCNPNWHGIHTATKGVTKNLVYWNSNPRQMVKDILSYRPRHVFYSGMCPGFDQVALLLHKSHPVIKQYVYYHGGISHYSFQKGLYGKGEQDAFQKILNLSEQGVFKRIACSSPGLAALLKKNNYDAQFCGNIFDLKDLSYNTKLNDGSWHVGNWNRHHDHKHTSIGIHAAKLVGATVHCLSGYPKVPGLDHNHVKEYGEMHQEALYEKYSQMDVNLQMSFIETFNISVLEMWAAKTPVLMGPGNYVLIKDSEILKEHCLVVDHTNPVEVAQKILDLFKPTIKPIVVKEQMNHLIRLNEQSQTRWEKFFK